MLRRLVRVAGIAMIWTTRTIGLLVTLALVAGGTVWGVHAALTPTADAGNDYGLDTNGNRAFDWLVVEARVSLPEAGTHRQPKHRGKHATMRRGLARPVH